MILLCVDQLTHLQIFKTPSFGNSSLIKRLQAVLLQHPSFLARVRYECSPPCRDTHRDHESTEALHRRPNPPSLDVARREIAVSSMPHRQSD
mmetsp:Transcript_12182/g.21008  ORF Transcript_12182/g.21008 Transcript_12182/m.21008 type:complete len:92 (+) Transcript_12182:242-517(+)